MFMSFRTSKYVLLCLFALAIGSVTGRLEAAPEDRSARFYLIADNQEREIFGQSTGFSGIAAQYLSKVAIRSLEQDLYSKYVVQHTVDTKATLADR